MPQPIGGGPEKIAASRAKIVGHLEAAHALADEINDATASLMIELALAKLREDNWPDSLDVPPRTAR